MRAYAHWLRAFSSTPASWASSVASWPRSAGCSIRATPPGSRPALAGGPTLEAESPTSSRCCASLSISGCLSVITHPWVEDAVEDVGDQVEDDDHGRSDHQPRHDRVGVGRPESVDEVEAHPIQREHRLRDDRAAKEGR